MTPEERIEERAQELFAVAWPDMEITFKQSPFSNRWRRLARYTFKLEMEAELRGNDCCDLRPEQIIEKYAGLLPEDEHASNP